MRIFRAIFVVVMAFVALAPSLVFAAANTSVVGVQGYDLVAYFTDKKPVKGNGNHVAVQDGVTYLFASTEHRKEFTAHPEKYLPQYGGWCAFGVTNGQKVVSDPLVWEVVQGKLYLNLDQRIADLWEKDVPGNITKADSTWTDIQDKDPSDL